MANEEHLKILEHGVERWNSWRKTNPKTRPDLSEVTLSRSGFRAPEKLADLSGIDLSGAILYRTLLEGANLSRANLYRSYLMGADLRRANLTGANLTRAKLYHTNLTLADLTGANLDQAVFWETVLARVNFSGALGLDSCRHGGPSIIDHRTLRKSQDQLPEAFLRGCGLPEALITYLPSLLNKAFEYYSCFISHSHRDTSFARRLHDGLQGRGIRCWLDERQMLPGHDIYEEVDRGIRLWDKVLLCASQHSLTSWWVDDEISRAFDKEQKLMKERGERVLALIPLNLDGYLFSGDWNSAKATQVKQRLAADFTGWQTDNDKFEEQFERVVRALRTDGGREAAPEGKL